MHDGSPTNGLILLLILVAFYLLPTLIAAVRGHHQTAAIFATNLLLGWSVLGWIAAFIWSLTAKRREIPEVVYVKQVPTPIPPPLPIPPTSQGD